MQSSHKLKQLTELECKQITDLTLKREYGQSAIMANWKLVSDKYTLRKVVFNTISPNPIIKPYQQPAVRYWSVGRVLKACKTQVLLEPIWPSIDLKVNKVSYKISLKVYIIQSNYKLHTVTSRGNNIHLHVDESNQDDLSFINAHLNHLNSIPLCNHVRKQTGLKTGLKTGRRFWYPKVEGTPS